MLDRDQPHEAWVRLAADPDDPEWNTSSIALMWRPWYAAAWAEAAALSGVPRLDQIFASARAHARGNPVAAALVRRAEALAGGDRDELAGLGETLGDLGARYQQHRSRQFSR